MQSQKPINGIVTFQDNHLDIHKYTISELSNMIGVNDNFSESNIKIKCNKLVASFVKLVHIFYITLQIL